MTMYVECRMHAHQPLFNGSIPNECRLQSDDIGNTFLLSDSTHIPNSKTYRMIYKSTNKKSYQQNNKFKFRNQNFMFVNLRIHILIIHRSDYIKILITSEFTSINHLYAKLSWISIIYWLWTHYLIYFLSILIFWEKMHPDKPKHRNNRSNKCTKQVIHSDFL